ncbi:hypothetical protein MMC29_001353 [Sticta canariensis]|nr:hypothetical protein [Sticta canariensis]
MLLQAEFEQAAQDANSKVSSNISNDDKLLLYGLYKQATVGDVNTSKPGILDQKGRAKWSPTAVAESPSLDSFLTDMSQHTAERPAMTEKSRTTLKQVQGSKA